MLNHCRVCNCANLKEYYRQGNSGEYIFYKCTHCGLVNLDLENVSIKENQEKYSLHFIDPKDPEKNQGAHKSFHYLRKMIKNTGACLDIGCGNGALLYLLQQSGWDVRGLELDTQQVAKIRETLAIRAEAKNFLDFDDESAAYDLIIMRHVLEHIPNSLQVVKKIASLLKNGGYALLEFPNIEGTEFRIKRALQKIGLSKKKYPPDYIPGHCNEFSRKSFEYLISLTELKILDWQTYSSKKIMNMIYSVIKTGNKARVILIK